jgi:hypothetical protein
MSILSSLGIGPSEAVKAATDAVNAGADVVERWAPGVSKQHDMAAADLAADAKNTAEARTYNPTTTVAGTGLLANITNTVNVLIDALNRLIRPGVAILLIGGTFGFWGLRVTTTDPVVLGWCESVVGFYFGVRAVTRDLPALLVALKQIRSSK